MKLVDVNVLIYAIDDRSAHHRSARPWLTAALGSGELVGIPTAVSVAFVRLTTSPRVMEAPLDAAAAVDVVRTLLSHPSVVVPEPTAQHYDVLAELLAGAGTAGNLVSDAHLAALAIEHGAQLCSYDGDFARFPGLRWFRPEEPPTARRRRRT